MVQRIQRPSNRLDHSNLGSLHGRIQVLAEQERRRSFFQLAGHTECFKLGLRPDTILKKATGNEEECLMKLQRDPYLARFVPKVYGKCEQGGQIYLELQDLLVGFNSAAVMDVKMGYRTYREDELYKALREAQLRHDMFEKMVEVDASEPTAEERRLKAVTKPRYMIWRESVSSTASLGFRIEGMRLRDGTIDKDFKTIKEEEQVARAFIRYTKSLSTRLKYLQILYDLKRALKKSKFFLAHEMIGSSLLFVHDDDEAGIWLIDFAKTDSLPEDVRVDHRNKWELGNHEDGYLAGVENLIRIFETITLSTRPLEPPTATLATTAAATATPTTATSTAVATNGVTPPRNTQAATAAAVVQ